jgi:hypothetical protein
VRRKTNYNERFANADGHEDYMRRSECEAARKCRPPEGDRQETGANLNGHGVWDGALCVGEPALEFGGEHSN